LTNHDKKAFDPALMAGFFVKAVKKSKSAFRIGKSVLPKFPATNFLFKQMVKRFIWGSFFLPLACLVIDLI
jgi:hypothetical protein